MMTECVFHTLEANLQHLCSFEELFYYAVILIVSSLSFITVNFEFCCRLWIDNRQLEFTTDYGLIIGSYGFYYRLWIENPSGCKLVMAAQRGIIKINHLQIII